MSVTASRRASSGSAHSGSACDAKKVSGKLRFRQLAPLDARHGRQPSLEGRAEVALAELVLGGEAAADHRLPLSRGAAAQVGELELRDQGADLSQLVLGGDGGQADLGKRQAQEKVVAELDEVEPGGAAVHGRRANRPQSFGRDRHQLPVAKPGRPVARSQAVQRAAAPRVIGPLDPEHSAGAKATRARLDQGPEEG